MTSVKSAGGNAIETYTYSQGGDRLSKAAPGLATGTYGYQSGTHWLTSIGNSARTYDANGSMTGNASGGIAWGFGYNGRGRLAMAQQGEGTLATYAYDALGERVSKTVGTSQTRFAYDTAAHLLSELGDASRDYVWLDNMPVAAVTGEGVVFIHVDDLNTPRAATDASGAQVWTFPRRANPFGETQPSTTNGTTINLRFPGQYFDAESGLNYNVHRDYEPATGRYIQSDPIGLRGGVSTYAYVGNNPLTYIDPLGLWSFSFEAYLGFGGGIQFGRDPTSGEWFYGGRIGVGVSVGGSLDPVGKRPGADGKDCTHGSTLGIFNEGGATAFFASWNPIQNSVGLNLDSSGNGYEEYGPADSPTLNRTPRKGFGIGWSTGIEVVGH